MRWDVDALLLDFGGTIDADGIHWGERFFQFYREAGIELPRAQFDEVFEKVDAEIQDRDVEHSRFRDLVALQVHTQCIHLKIESGVIQQQVVDRAVRDAAVCIEGNKKILQQCARCLRLGLVSNYHGNLLTVCREFGLDDIFGVIVDSKIVRVENPNPKPFEIALGALRVEPERAAFVSDSYNSDIVGSKSLGLKTIWLQHEMNRIQGDPTKIDTIVRSLEELGTLICSEC
ncbi:MAG: HAD family hydrolase [Bacteroidota bacterium]